MREGGTRSKQPLETRRVDIGMSANRSRLNPGRGCGDRGEAVGGS